MKLAFEKNETFLFSLLCGGEGGFVRFCLKNISNLHNIDIYKEKEEKIKI